MSNKQQTSRHPRLPHPLTPSAGRHTTLPQCNLLFTQKWNNGSDVTALFPSTSDFFARYNVVRADPGSLGLISPFVWLMGNPTTQTSTSLFDDTNVQLARLQAGNGFGAMCEIPHVGQRGSVGDVGECWRNGCQNGKKE